MHKTPSNYVQQTLQRQREVQKHFWGKLKKQKQKQKKKTLIHNSSISFLGMALKLKPFLDLLTEQTIRLNRWLRNTGGHPHKVFAMSRCGNLEIQMCKWSESNCMNLDWPQRQTEYASKHQYMDLLVMCSQENSILKKIMKTSCEPHIVDVPGSKQEKKVIIRQPDVWLSAAFNSWKILCSYWHTQQECLLSKAESVTLAHTQSLCQ